MMRVVIKNKLLQGALVFSVAAMLTGCAATQVAIEHRNLEVQTKMSQTIFLDPVPQSQKTIYVDIRNTSDKGLKLQQPIKKTIEAHGYQVVSNPNRAHYLLQANVLQVGKLSQSAARAALNGGYGSTIGTVATGAALGAYSGSASGALAGGLIGGLASTVADSIVREVNFVMITDIQISERANRQVKISQQTQSELNNGTATKTIQTSHERTPFKRYRTRIVSNADKVNLKFNMARSALEGGLVKAISGIF